MVLNIFENNNYQKLSDKEEKQYYTPPESVLNAIPIPDTCERCRKNPPKIGSHDKIKGTVEFICYICLNNDSKINKLTIKKKFDH